MESKSHQQRLTTTAIAGILFFAYFIKKSPWYLNENTENREFLDHYLQIGEINLILLVLGLCCFGINFFLKNDFIGYLYTFISRIIIFFSTFSILFAIGGYKINFTRNANIQPLPLFKFYLPFYNFQLRYQQNNYERPSRRLKESILWWNILIFTRLFLGQTLGIITLGILIIRLLFLFFHIDLIPNELKIDINKIFLKYPQEIFAYIENRFHKKKEEESEQEYILQKKHSYQYALPINGKRILQYLITGIIPLCLFLCQGIPNIGSREGEFKIITFSFFYLCMIGSIRYHCKIKGNLPPLPFIHQSFSGKILPSGNTENH